MKKMFKRWKKAFDLWKHFNSIQTKYTGFRECLDLADFIDVIE
jgi:hypothetical protein